MFRGALHHPDLENFKLNLQHLKKGKTVVEVDPKYFRPTEVDILLGDASKAREKLGWKPEVTLALFQKSYKNKKNELEIYNFFMNFM
ncbi:GDP-mannose 4,6-dehydratase [Thermosipho ferrireducens]|uniref:GDP-mannose 4,6-dehydratase n=1 Tax=Thermosipho ferrireducens TaxID=2571116 RepID=UPI001D18967E|nr:GDP-mannose 4,6-dehydratase [Thermosipho ferrireducens]